jgi:hypothetical protein
MKIDRIEIEEFRRFQRPLVLDGLAPGLNVFVGHNEAGKSTVAAALRAAFLERFKTRAVADLAPWGMSQARPTVTLDFHIGETHYRLCKSFLSRPRCELSEDRGRRRYEGEEAEDMLAQLLGFQFAGKGLSRPEHAGIPGLLWIAQGDSQQVLAAAGHAGPHLREALTRLSGELAASDGDRLFTRISEERAVLLDPRGRSKGGLKAADDARVQAAEVSADLSREKDALDADVDKLASLRSEHGRAEREQAWTGLEEKAREARARMAAAGLAREQVERLTREAAQLAANQTLLADQMARDRDDSQAIERLDAQWKQTREATEGAEHALQAAARQLAENEARALAARARREAARAAFERRDLVEQITRLQDEIERLAGNRREAEGLAQRVQALAAQCAGVALDAGGLQALRQAEQQLAQKLAQQQAMAARLSYRLAPGQQVRIDGQAVSGEGEWPVTSRIEIDIAEVGRLQVEPGGRDLPALAAAIASARQARDGVLARLAVATLAEAEAQWVAHERALGDLALARKELALYAPEGAAALAPRISQAQVRLAQLQARLQALLAAHAEARATAPDGAADSASGSMIASPAAGHTADIAEADAAALAEQEAENGLAHARKALAAAATRADTLRAQAHLLAGQLEPRRAAWHDPLQQNQRLARAQQSLQTEAAATVLAEQLRQARATLAAHRPELAEQDAARFDLSARIAREAHQARHGAILQLQGRLEQAGASGVGERLAEAQAEEERLARRAHELGRRAAALDLLTTLLAQQRQAATLRLQAPLAQRLQHYLPLLFPSGELRLDEAFAPAALARGDTVDTLESLSFGTREQLGVLTRFAYADLLRQAGRPTLIVLDDALVHSDDDRREFMKRALFDAATRHQILMFTCHGESWRDLGVPQRQLSEAVSN